MTSKRRAATGSPFLCKCFHDYGLLWMPEEYVFYVDGREIWRTQAGGVSQVPEYLKLTDEIGAWGGDIKKADLPDYFEVDYVRVFELDSLTLRSPLINTPFQRGGRRRLAGGNRFNGFPNPSHHPCPATGYS